MINITIRRYDEWINKWDGKNTQEGMTQSCKKNGKGSRKLS